MAIVFVDAAIAGAIERPTPAATPAVGGRVCGQVGLRAGGSLRQPMDFSVCAECQMSDEDSDSQICDFGFNHRKRVLKRRATPPMRKAMCAISEA